MGNWGAVGGLPGTPAEPRARGTAAGEEATITALVRQVGTLSSAGTEVAGAVPAALAGALAAAAQAQSAADPQLALLRAREAVAATGAAGRPPPRLQRLFGLFGRHPLGSALLIWLVDLLVINRVTPGTQAWLPALAPDFAAVCVVAGVTALAIAVLGWWRVIGFNRPCECRDLRVLILPTIAVFTSLRDTHCRSYPQRLE